MIFHKYSDTTSHNPSDPNLSEASTLSESSPRERGTNDGQPNPLLESRLTQREGTSRRDLLMSMASFLTLPSIAPAQPPITHPRAKWATKNKNSDILSKPELKELPAVIGSLRPLPVKDALATRDWQAGLPTLTRSQLITLCGNYMRRSMDENYLRALSRTEPTEYSYLTETAPNHILKLCLTYNINVLLAFPHLAFESRFGTKGMAAKTHNIANIGNWPGHPTGMLNYGTGIEVYFAFLAKRYLKDNRTVANLIASGMSLPNSKLKYDPLNANYPKELTNVITRYYDYIQPAFGGSLTSGFGGGKPIGIRTQKLAPKEAAFEERSFTLSGWSKELNPQDIEAVRDAHR
jgi:hypothetical protein